MNTPSLFNSVSNEESATAQDHWKPSNTGGTCLCDAINNYAKEIMKTHLVKIIFNSFQDFDVEIPEKLKMNIFRTMKKYLDVIATKKNLLDILICLSQNKTRILLSIADHIRPDSIDLEEKMIDLKIFERDQAGKLNIISNKYFGSCLVYDVDLK